MRTSPPEPASMAMPEVWPLRIFRCQLIANKTTEPTRILSIIRWEKSYVEAFDRADVLVRERQTNKLSWEVELTEADFSKLLRSNDESSERENSTYLYECVNLRLTFEIVLQTQEENWLTSQKTAMSRDSIFRRAWQEYELVTDWLDLIQISKRAKLSSGNKHT
jgi:hypothetical protein